MRKITRQIIEASIECRSFTISNSRTDETSLYLHGNRIAWHDGNNKLIMVSRTAKAHGFGSDKYKWVSGLTKEEQKHVKDGTAIVIVTRCPGHINGVSGIKYRQVSYGPYGYKHFIPSAETIRTISGHSDHD